MEAPGSTTATQETGDFAREWTEILNEIRVALPGVQLIFGFLLAAPFTEAFHAASGVIRYAYFVCFLSTTASSAFLIAPSVYHRLHWRRDVRDKELMLRTCNALAIAGVAFLALSMIAAVYVVSRVIAGHVAAALVSASAGVLIVGLWFVLPLARRSAERQQPPG